MWQSKSPKDLLDTCLAEHHPQKYMLYWFFAGSTTKYAVLYLRRTPAFCYFKFNAKNLSCMQGQTSRMLNLSLSARLFLWLRQRHFKEHVRSIFRYLRLYLSSIRLPSVAFTVTIARRIALRVPRPHLRTPSSQRISSLRHNNSNHERQKEWRLQREGRVPLT